MPEYINRTAFLEQYRSLYCSDCDRRKNSNGKIVYEIGDAPCRACDTGDMLDSVEDFPAADVVEVRHGSDVSRTVKGHCEFKCSLCGAYALVVEGGTLDGGIFNYCPNCGAKMGGGDGDG
jgi:hypothetical protein